MSNKYVHARFYRKPTYLLGGVITSERTPVKFSTLLQHEEDELKKARTEGDADKEWSEFEYHLNQIKEKMPSDKHSTSYYHTFWLGFYAGSLSHYVSTDEQHQALSALCSQSKSQLALRFRNICREQVKTLAQNLAEMEWAKPEHSQTKVSAMSELIFNLISKYGGKDYEDMRKEIPKTSNGIKGWISEIAPEFAKKGGRPKK